MGEKNRFFYIGMGAGFVLAFGILWLAMPYMQAWAERHAAPAPVARAETVPEVVGAEDLARFLQAVEQGDFAAAQRVGGAVFLPGRVVLGKGAALSGYEANSHPPYMVYGFLTESTETAARRILLTLDDRDRVVSFLAEEMPVTR